VSGGHPRLDTPLGRTWLRAASIQQSLLNASHDIDPTVRELIIELAHGQKVLAEYIELIINERNTGERT
jgi:hypothetical protein